tara:strand:+ start:478 stop:594 length:117 start_codon:yes stop_codon:yes gene_type:complete
MIPLKVHTIDIDKFFFSPLMISTPYILILIFSEVFISA